MKIDWSVGVANLTPFEIKEHQNRAFDPDRESDPTMKAVVSSFRSMRLAEYRQYLLNVERRQNNITTGFDLEEPK